MENLSLFLTIIVTLFGLILPVVKAIAKSEQSLISSALLPHDQQVANKHIQNMVLVLVVFILLFLEGLMPNRNFSAITDFIDYTFSSNASTDESIKLDNIVITNGDTTITIPSGNTSKRINTSEPKTDGSNNNINSSNGNGNKTPQEPTTIVNIIAIVMLSFPLILPLIFVLWLYFKDNKANSTRGISSYATIAFYTMIFLYIVVLNAIMGMSISTKELLLSDLLISSAGAIFMRLLISELSPAIDKQVGNITTEKDGKIYYCFETVEGKLLVGDSKFISECSEFKLLEIKDNLILKQKPMFKNCIKLKKTNIIYNNINEESRESAIRKAILHCLNTPNLELNENTIIVLTYNPDMSTLECKINNSDQAIPLNQDLYTGKYKFIN